MSDPPRHPLLQEIATAEDLPAAAIARCMLCIPEVAPELLAAIARAADGPLTSQSDLNLAYYGVFILAAAREPRLQAPLLRLLRLPDDALHQVLGGEYPTPLPRIAVGAFDGDAQPLFGLLCDADASEFVRMSLFGAVAYLTWLGSIPAETTRAFLHRFDLERAIPAGDIGWNGWEMAIELLGWDAFAPLVEAAYADGRLDTGISELRLFREGLAAAAGAAPDDDKRFKRQEYGYIEDVVEAIEIPAPLLGGSDDAEFDDEALDEFEVNDLEAIAREPVAWDSGAQGTRHNPMRHVGRNDPCPCGSGKKYKKCCLAA